MEKLKRVWNLVLVPTAFFLGAMNMWIGETSVGCLFILFATNETINNDKQIRQSMHYEIVIPIEIKDIYYNFGIDFWTQQITATNKVINKDEVIVNLKQLGLRLDNKIIKNYNIVKQKYEIRIWIECIKQQGNTIRI